MILFKDYLPGNLAQVNFKKLYFPSKKTYLSRTTRQDLAQAPSSLELTPNKFPQ